MSVRVMLTLSILIEIHTKSVYFVLAYTQVDVKSDIFMEIPICFGVEGYHLKEWFIRLYKNLYALKDVYLIWFEKLKAVLEAREFFKSQVNPCVWYKEEMSQLFYVYGFLIFSPSKDKIDAVYTSLHIHFNI